MSTPMTRTVKRKIYAGAFCLGRKASSNYVARPDGAADPEREARIVRHTARVQAELARLAGRKRQGDDR